MSTRILTGDCRELLKTLPAQSVHCCVTSPPYFGLRDYGIAGQIGLEPTPDAFVAELVSVFAEVRRVLRDDGTLWLNLGDSYASGGRANYGFTDPDSKQASHAAIKSSRRPEQPPGLKPKDLIGIPWRVAFALQADGWYLRQDVIWSKPNPMPESVTDRCTKAHEYIFLLSKSARYYYDAATIEENTQTMAGATWAERKAAGAIAGNIGSSETYQRGVHGNGSAGSNLTRQDGHRNKRSVWEVATQPFAEAHFATFPPDLIEPCIKAGCPKGGIVLDPFGGAGTTGLVADRLGRDAILIELNPEYAAMTERRICDDAGMFAEVWS